MGGYQSGDLAYQKYVDLEARVAVLEEHIRLMVVELAIGTDNMTKVCRALGLIRDRMRAERGDDA